MDLKSMDIPPPLAAHMPARRTGGGGSGAATGERRTGRLGHEVRETGAERRATGDGWDLGVGAKGVKKEEGNGGTAFGIRPN